ncbi:MAG: alpha/beta hydrolase [Bacteroidetes bacterium]|nr:alpha/beta hydrolase [Bacteroidota bacterium]MBK8345784.1 alpha/beta hydrolase [Bacteroidota bacterium]
MRKLLLSAAIATVLLASCKDKLEKKDKSLAEMQNEDENPNNYEPVLSTADATPVYKKINDTVEMHLNIYYPEKHKKQDPTAVIIYFFGGAFLHGSPSQYEPHCQYFASRGIVAITADYRVISRNKGNALSCIYDAKSAVRYVREHAEELNIDPNKVIVGGGSAGGFLAIECAMDDSNWQDPTDNTAVSCKPNAMVLLNPVVNSMEHDFRIVKFKDDEKAPDSESHAGAINPLTNIKSGMPPAIIFHGKADRISGFQYVQQFCTDYQAAGNTAELHAYDKMKHGFTSVKFQDGKYYKESLKLSDEFLIKLGFLTGTPTVQ